MRALLITTAIISFLLLMIQETRHVYVKFLEPTPKYLASRYSMTLSEEAGDIDELKKLTSEDLDHELKVNRQKSKDERNRKRGDDKQFRPDGNDELDQKSARIEQVLMEREQRTLQLHETHFYWWIGFVSVVLGTLFMFKSYSWFGIALLTFGYSEMIFWTFPSYRVLSSGGEFERLLTWKLIYNSGSLVSLISIWIIFCYRERKLQLT